MEKYSTIAALNARINSSKEFDRVCCFVLGFLQSTPGVSQVSLSEGGGAREPDLQKWEQQHEVTLPGDIRAFYLLANGLTIRWSAVVGENTDNPQHLPIGSIHVNNLHELKPVPLRRKDKLRLSRDRSEVYKVVESIDVDCSDSDLEEGASAGRNRLNGVYPLGFQLDKLCDYGRVVFVCQSRADWEVWFQDLSCNWWLVGKSFSDYFRLLLLHLGIRHWQYAFTDSLVDPLAAQWLNLFCSKRYALDQEGRHNRLSEALLSEDSANTSTSWAVSESPYKRRQLDIDMQQLDKYVSLTLAARKNRESAPEERKSMSRAAKSRPGSATRRRTSSAPRSRQTRSRSRKTLSNARPSTSTTNQTKPVVHNRRSVGKQPAAKPAPSRAPPPTDGARLPSKSDTSTSRGSYFRRSSSKTKQSTHTTKQGVPRYALPRRRGLP